MKPLIEYITEQIKFEYSDQGLNTPDSLSINIDGYGNIHMYYFENESSIKAYAFIRNNTTNKVYFSEPGHIHYEILEKMSKDEIKQLGLSEAFNNKDFAIKSFKTGEAHRKCSMGRLWVVTPKLKGYITPDGKIESSLFKISHYYPDADSLEDIPSKSAVEHDTIYMCWWNELKGDDFKKFSKDVINQFSKSHEKIDDYYVIDNNGEQPLHLSEDNKIKIVDRTSKAEEEINKKYNNHIPKPGETLEEFRKRKRRATEQYRKNRDIKNQEKYNKEENNKSHTSAEHNYRNRTITDYKTGKTRPYDGDSLHTNIKPLKD